MNRLRSERFSASLLLGAAVLGLLLANTALGPWLIGLQGTHLGVAGFDLSVGHWISDGLLAVFFFIVAVELKQEMTTGELNSVRRALHPAIAALGGVIIPAGLYLLLTSSSGETGGWPIPTATDIAFAVGVLAMFGRGLPSRIRVFLLALAVLDDLVAILIIAVFFTADPDLLALGFAALSLLAFAILSRIFARRGGPVLGGALILLAVLTWGLVYQSGVHATIAGVLLGLVMPALPAQRLTHRLEPFSNGLVLPLFAFSATLVMIPQLPVSELSAPFWAILIALPVGKLLGITAGGLLGSVVMRGGGSGMRPGEIVLVALLGGIGFTVSLLMTELAFTGDGPLKDQGILAVLLGSLLAVIASAIALTLAARRARRTASITRG